MPRHLTFETCENQMDAKTKRKHLRDYTSAAREIELAHAAITILESLNGATPERCIKQLNHYAGQALRRMDAAASKLGAPYEA